MQGCSRAGKTENSLDKRIGYCTSSLLLIAQKKVTLPNTWEKFPSGFVNLD